ncbi:MAG: FAD-binding oxidoreductase [Nocardioidaceae bacterium]
MTEMHWSRWGDPARAGRLPEGARALVEAAFGRVEEHRGTRLDDVALPDPGLSESHVAALRDLVGAEHVLLDREARIRHTRGKSTPDLLRIRAGDAQDAPDAVVLPADHDQVAGVLAWCSAQRVALVPFGGGTSVVGGLAARDDGYAGVVALDLRRLDGLLALDPESETATLEAGMRGPQAETLLGEHGFTLGHFPQSFEYATIGGFAATRSSGQASSGYGRFDDLVVGVRVATPIGDLRLGSAPASAAGPDLRQLVLGSEGAFGVITAVTVRVRRRPALRVYEAWRFTSFRDGAAALRRLAQTRTAPSVLRLSDESETAVNLTRPDQVGGQSAGGCLMVVGHEGDDPGEVQAGRDRVTATLTELGGTPLGEQPGVSWAQSRFDAPYMRDSMLDLGVLVETLETATFWSNLATLYDAVRAALESALGPEPPAIVLCHISHVYDSGASLYFTVGAKQGPDPVTQWAAAKAAASDAIVAAGGTITHHHAVGRDHRPWLAGEIGPVGVEILRAVKQRIDPAGVLNPGVLVP